jgi:hypothetical protein
VGRGLGFAGRGEIERWPMQTCRGRSPALEDGDDRWTPGVSESERRDSYRFGKRPSGPWAKTEAGPNGFPSAFYSFSIFFSLFYFSDF